MSAESNVSMPIPMILHCPECRARHIDTGEFATRHHHTHSCQSCGFTWRPAIVDTVGVQFLPGFKDSISTVLAETPVIQPDVLVIMGPPLPLSDRDMMQGRVDSPADYDALLKAVREHAKSIPVVAVLAPTIHATIDYVKTGPTAANGGVRDDGLLGGGGGGGQVTVDREGSLAAPVVTTEDPHDILCDCVTCCAREGAKVGGRREETVDPGVCASCGRVRMSPPFGHVCIPPGPVSCSDGNGLLGSDAPPAPPGFRIVGRSGPRVTVPAGSFLQLADEAPWKAADYSVPVDEASWTAGMYRILEPIAEPTEADWRCGKPVSGGVCCIAKGHVIPCERGGITRAFCGCDFVDGHRAPCVALPVPCFRCGIPTLGRIFLTTKE